MRKSAKYAIVWTALVPLCGGLVGHSCAAGQVQPYSAVADSWGRYGFGLAGFIVAAFYAIYWAVNWDAEREAGQ